MVSLLHRATINNSDRSSCRDVFYAHARQPYRIAHTRLDIVVPYAYVGNDFIFEENIAIFRIFVL